MPELEALIRDASRLLFVGVGNVLKQDDGVGVHISRSILPRANILSITVEVSIENYIGKINSIHPEQMVIIDATELGTVPGTYRLLTLEEIADRTFHTHGISLVRMKEFFPFPVFVLGIQPASLEFGDRMTPHVRDCAEKIIDTINP